MTADGRSGNNGGFVQGIFPVVGTGFGQGEDARELLAALDEDRRTARASVRPICGKVVARELPQSPCRFARGDLAMDVPVGEGGRSR